MPLSLLAAILLQTSPSPIPITKALGISGVTQGGRVPAPVDLIQAKMADGTWKAPAAGETTPGVRNEATWTEMTANKDGVFEGPAIRGGYVFATYDSPKDQPMLLQAAGDSLVYINGVPRGGDPYGYGYLKIPFLLKKGRNEFLFSCGRGQLSANLIPLDLGTESLQFNDGDMTLPDIIVGKEETLVAAIPIINGTSKWTPHLSLAVRSSDLGVSQPMSDIPPLAPWSVRKVPFLFKTGARATPGEVSITIDFGGARGGFGFPKPVTTKIRVRRPTEHYKRTFISKIDGSVQYYAVSDRKSVV